MVYSVSQFQGTICDDRQVLAIELWSRWSRDIDCQKGEIHKSSWWVSFLLSSQSMTLALGLVPSSSGAGLLMSISLIKIVPQKYAQRLTSKTIPPMCLEVCCSGDSGYWWVGKLLITQFARGACTYKTLYKWRLYCAGLGYIGNRKVCRAIIPTVSVILEQRQCFRNAPRSCPSSRRALLLPGQLCWQVSLCPS